MPPHIFLSYSVRDRDRVTRLRNALHFFTVHVWPEGMLTPGNKIWRDEFYDAVAQAACVVVALSPDTQLSQWVILALEAAQDLRCPIIPVVVKGSAGHVMLAKLDGNDWFDLRWSWNYRSEIEGLVTVIRRYTDESVVETH